MGFGGRVAFVDLVQRQAVAASQPAREILRPQVVLVGLPVGMERHANDVPTIDCLPDLGVAINRHRLLRTLVTPPSCLYFTVTAPTCASVKSTTLYQLTTDWIACIVAICTKSTDCSASITVALYLSAANS